MALTDEQQRVAAAAERLKATFPTAAYAYVLALRRQLPAIDRPEDLANYQRVADEAERLADLVERSERP